MEKALQHQTTLECSGLPPSGAGNHRPDGAKADHALTIKLDCSCGADPFHVRLQWWKATARTWREIAISVPSLEDLTDAPLPETLTRRSYPTTARPVFSGHCWLSGDPAVQARNALCLDYSAGKAGPLTSYDLTDPTVPLSRDGIRIFPSVS